MLEKTDIKSSLKVRYCVDRTDFQTLHSKIGSNFRIVTSTDAHKPCNLAIVNRLTYILFTEELYTSRLDGQHFKSGFLNKVISHRSLVELLFAYRCKLNSERLPQRKLWIIYNPKLTVTATFRTSRCDGFFQSSSKL